MKDNTESTESSNREALIRAERHFEPTYSNSESGSRNDHGDFGRQQHGPPLGVALTGYRLFATCMVLGPGIAKAVYSYRGQSLISTTVDWVAGIIIVVLLFWLGVIEAYRPELSPAFFQTDLVVLCLRYLTRDRVLNWLWSLIFVSYAIMPLLVLLTAKCDEEQSCRYTLHFIKAALPLSVLALSAYISILCSICLKVRRPIDFEVLGKEYHRFLCITNFLMWMACNVYFQAFMIVVVLFREDLKYDNMVGTAIPFIYNYAGMFYANKFVIALKEDADGDRGGHSPYMYLKITMAATFLTTISVFAVFLAFLDMRILLLFVVSFTFLPSCFVLFRTRSFLEVRKFGVSFISNLWRSAIQ